jgi:hypothetical protein
MSLNTRYLSDSAVAGVRKKRGGFKMRQNFPKLLKTNIENMSAFTLSTMSMKTRWLNPSLHDVNEKIEGY